MKRQLYPAVALLLLIGSAFTAVHDFAPQNWQIAEGYNIGFASDDAGGAFKDFKGTILFDDANPVTSKFDVTIQVASINTGNGLQNKHAKSDEWLDVTKYPTIRYVSTTIVRAGNGYSVSGNLTLHGVTKPVMIPFTFQKTAKGAVFAGTFTVNRSDFNVGKPGGDVAEKIKIDISVPVTK